MRARRHLALLRGINVAGKNRLPMEALRAMFDAAGCTDVETYIQSGNVVFSAPAKTVKGLATAIQAAIEAGVGLKVPVVLRTRDSLAEVLERNPFLSRGARPEELHVVFLADAPEAAAVKALDANRSPPDAFEVRGREVYLRCPKGCGQSKLTNAWFDSKLSTVSTVRNWRTVNELLALCDGRA